MQNGRISLAMRNPADKNPVSPEATILDQGRLAKLGLMMESSVPGEQLGPGMIDFTDINNLKAIIDANSVQPATPEDSEGYLGYSMPTIPRRRISPQWQVTVIKGKNIEEEVLEMSEGESE
jgi:hypothetical protein